MNITVVSSNYPSAKFPNRGAFVYNLMQLLADKHNIDIIAPFKFHYFIKKNKESYGKEKCKVTRPGYLSLSQKNILGLNTGNLSIKSYNKSVLGVLKKKKIIPDLIYAHFLSNAFAALEYVKEHNIPLIIASGESTYKSWKNYSFDLRNQLIESVSHIICVSNENYHQLIDLGFDENKMTIIPNAVDYNKFAPLNRNECKIQIGANTEKFSVGFIGHFIERKGPNRIIQAIQDLNDEEIELICVGDSADKLIHNSFTKVINSVPNYKLPIIYNSFDVFVLPTLHEGHCNVIEEAKAVGIPIISSKGTSVEEQINESVGILVDPLNINEIAQAIAYLKNDSSLRVVMKDNLIRLRGSNSLEERAEKINNIIVKLYNTNN